MFIKHGDGTIVHVIEKDKLTDDQKQAVKEMSKELVKKSDDNLTDSSDTKKSGS